MEILERIPIKKDSVNWRKYNKGAILENGLALNESATDFWEAIDGIKTVKKLVEVISNKYQDADKHMLTEDFLELLNTFEEYEAITYKKY